MFYFAYGSNLNHQQMKKRCKDSIYIKNFFLKNYQLSFCAVNENYGAANIVKKSMSKVIGCVWRISVSDEKELDYYEDFPTKYTKDFFTHNNKKVMFYIMKKNHSYKLPIRKYVDIINQGYKDCGLDIKYLKKRLMFYNIEL